MGDTVFTYLDNQLLHYKRQNTKTLVLAYLGNTEAIKEVKAKYHLADLRQYKLLRNSRQFLASFVCELVREAKLMMLDDVQPIEGRFSYETAQELIRIFSMFGIKTYIRKRYINDWSIFVSVKHFLDNIMKKNAKYKVVGEKILNIEQVKQETQAYKVACKNLVVDTIMVNGDA